jgi:hypothetical protein
MTNTATVYKPAGTGSHYSYSVTGQSMPKNRPFVLGQTKPTNLNTGILFAPTDTSYPAYNSTSQETVSITTPNTVIENKVIHGRVKILAPGCKLKNCAFTGTNILLTHYQPIIDGSAANAHDAEISDCTIVPKVPQIFQYGILGVDLKVERTRVIWCNDSFQAYSDTSILPKKTNFHLYGNYGSDNCYWHGNTPPPSYLNASTAPHVITTYDGRTLNVVDDNGDPAYPNNSDGTHNDWCQIKGGRGGPYSIHIRGNMITNSLAINGVHPLADIGWGPSGTGIADWAARIPPTLGTPLDCPAKYKYDTTTAARVDDPKAGGRYVGYGQGIVHQAGVSDFSDDQTVVIEENWFDFCGTALSIQGVGAPDYIASSNSGKIGLTIINNRFGDNWRNNSHAGTTYHFIRGDYKSKINMTQSGNVSSGTFFGAVGTVLTEGTFNTSAGIEFENA